MRMDYLDIKKELEDNWERITESKYPEDILCELADSSVPIYYGDIIRDWQEMDSEWDNYWKESYGETVPDSIGITDLMSADLYGYYQSQYQRAYDEIKSENEED